MTTDKFEQILLRPESNTLDYKKEQYKIINDYNNLKTSEFIKDIISFSNTIRNESCYIIIGIKENVNGRKEFIGLMENEHIDEATFQQKLENKVFPIPAFSYQIIFYKNITCGIIEIPLTKYIKPIVPTIKMKGLEPGKVYFRRGTSNSEATTFEAIEISNWLNSLPDSEFNEVLFSILSQLNSNTINLSASISEILKFATKYNIEDLKQFCLNEIGGYKIKIKSKNLKEKLSFRIGKILCSTGQLKIPAISGDDYRAMMSKIKNLEGIQEANFFFKDKIIEFEEQIRELSTSNCKILIRSDDIDNVKWEFYFSLDDVMKIYNNIRNKLINDIIQIQKHWTKP